MRKYQKPEITILSFLSKEAISQSLNDWLATQPNLDAGIQDAVGANAIDSYDISSIIG